MAAYLLMNKNKRINYKCVSLLCVEQKINYKRDSLFVINNNKKMNYKHDSLFCNEKIKESITNVSVHFVMNKKWITNATAYLYWTKIKMNYKRDSLLSDVKKIKNASAYFGTSTSWRTNFSAFPSFVLSPSNDFNISTSSCKERSTLRPTLSPILRSILRFCSTDGVDVC